MDGPDVDAYEQASAFLVKAVSEVPGEAWGRLALGEWTVRDLVGHANRAHLLIGEYLERPVPEHPMDSEYFNAKSIAGRGRQAVALLGDDPIGAVRKAGQEAVAIVRSTAADAFLGSPVRHQTLAEYLPSRVAELTVHALDLQAALGLRLSPPPGALRVSLVYVAERVVAKGEGVMVLRALAGRGMLDSGFSVF